MSELPFSESASDNSYLLIPPTSSILEVWVLHDAQQVFSVMSDVRTQLFRMCRRQLIPPGFRCVNSASLSLLGRTTSIFPFDWRENPILEKLPEKSHTFCFTMLLMPLVHSSSFCVVRRKTNFLRYRSLDKSILQKLPATPSIASFWRILISAVQSVRLRPVRRKTSFLYPEWVRTQLSESARDNSYLLFYNDLYVSCNILEVWGLYDAQPVFSVMSDVRI